MTTGFKRRNSSIKDAEENLLTSRPATLKRWHQYSSDLYKDKNKYGPNTLQKLRQRSTIVEETEETVMREEVVKAVQRMKDCGKSPGPDGIPAELIKAGGEEVINQLHQLCNLVWDHEQWPSDWGKSVLITLPKKGNLTECSNYRTIALISDFSP